MTYARDKRLLLGWLALVAPIPLPFNEIVQWPYLATFMVACLLFLGRAARDPGGWLPTWAMNVLALAYLPYFLFDLAVLSRGRLVVSVTHLLLFTVLVKLFAIRRERDKWQTAIAVFFLFLTAMGTSVHPTVVLYLGLFLTLSLMVFARFAQLHLAAAFAGTEAQRRALRAVPMGRFLAVATLATLIVAVPLFVVLPRVESPFVSGQGRGLGTRGAATGFSDQVTLDTIGSIRTNREVAMRLRYEGGVPPGHELRYKGGAFERYEQGVWTPRSGRSKPIRPQGDAGGAFVLAPDATVGQAEVFLRPVAGRNVLLPVEAVWIEADARVLFLDDRGVARRFSRSAESAEYRVGLAAEPVSKARPPFGPGGSEELEAATLDLSGVTPRIADLAADIAGEGSLGEQARRIEQYFTSEFEYSLDFVGSRGEDPISHFLFERREGHCEYFATAMVLMLRSRGIPARLATGFLGGEYNPLEDYFIVRQSNAHAWVEAYLTQEGWTVFDPTPPAGRPGLGETGWRQVLAQGWDYLLFRWDRYVLTYGAGDQVQALFFLRSAWQEVARWFGGDDEAEEEEPAVIEGAEDEAATEVDAPEPGLSLWVLAVLLAFVAAGGLALWWWSRAPVTGRDAYRRLRRSAARAGLPVAPSDAPLRFGRRLAARFPSAAAPAQEVLQLYVRESWKEEELGPEETRRLGEAVKEAATALKKAG